jgi:hypothetical protein
MTNQHPITPPPELLDKWDNLPMSTQEIFVVAAQWGADQELKAVEEEIITQAWFAVPVHRLAQLRAARRPKPPSDKELALNALSLIMSRHPSMFDGKPFDTIRRVLEALPE